MRQTIVILHGWGLAGKKYLSLAREFEQAGYSVFSPDLPGFGGSQVPTGRLHLIDYARFLNAYLDEHNIKQARLVGHSFGGRVALLFQQLYPDRVKAIILSGTPGFSPVHKGKIAFYILLSKIGGNILSLPVLNLFKDRARLKYYYLVGARDFYQAHGVMRETFKNIVQEELVSPMKAVDVPCLLLWGEKDTICPVVIARRMKDVIPQAKLLEIQNAGHAVPFTQAKLFASRALAFFKSV